MLKYTNYSRARMCNLARWKGRLYEKKKLSARACMYSLSEERAHCIAIREICQYMQIRPKYIPIETSDFFFSPYMYAHA